MYCQKRQGHSAHKMESCCCLCHETWSYCRAQRDHRVQTHIKTKGKSYQYLSKKGLLFFSKKKPFGSFLSPRLYFLLWVQGSWEELRNRGPNQDLGWRLYFWDRIHWLSFSWWNCGLCLSASGHDAQQVLARHWVHQLLNHALNKFAYNIMDH